MQHRLRKLALTLAVSGVLVDVGVVLERGDGPHLS
jgi:hypothetical protein